MQECQYVKWEHINRHMHIYRYVYTHTHTTYIYIYIYILLAFFSARQTPVDYEGLCLSNVAVSVTRRHIYTGVKTSKRNRSNLDPLRAMYLTLASRATFSRHHCRLLRHNSPLFFSVQPLCLYGIHPLVFSRLIPDTG